MPSKCWVLASASALAMSAGSALAQQAPAPLVPPANSNTVTTLGEIVVTAQKRSENVQQIPKDVEVISQSSLAQAGVTNLGDLSLVSTSIQGTSTSGSPPAIRGVSSFAYSIGVQAQTGVVLDDIPQPNFSTLANELSDVERVEILPGPQSTLSGRNAAGGLINIVTRSPSSVLKANVTIEGADDHQERVAGYVSGPINDQFGFSVSGFYDDWDGPLYNVATGHRLGGWDRSGVRVKLRYQPTSKLTATLTAYYTHNDARTAALTAGYPYVFLSPGAESYFVAAPLQSLLPFTAKPYNHDIYSAYEGKLNSQDTGVSLHLDYDTPVGTLSSITNVSTSKTDTSTPLVAFSFFPNVPVQQNYNVDSTSQEFRLTSPSSLGKLQYLVGLIYSDTKINEPYDRALIAPVDWDRTAVLQSTALYGHATYEILPQTFLTGGVRGQFDHQSYTWVFLDGTAPTANGSNNYNFVTGEVSVRHEFTRAFNAYVTYSNAQTGRAYDMEDNVDVVLPGGLKPLASEGVQNIEVGFKSRWFDHRLTFNASLFDAKYQNYQIQNAFLPSPGALASIRLYAIGKVESRGAEFESAWTATPDLVFNVSATFLDAAIRDYPNAPCYTGETLASCATSPGVQGNLSGVQLPGSSRFKGIASANYTLRLPSLPFDGIVGVFYRYQSSTHYDLTNDPVSYISGFGIVNLSAGIQDRDHRYTLQVFVNNLFDKNYYAGLARDTVTYDTHGANPDAVYGGYARDSFRYVGVRLNVAY